MRAAPAGEDILSAAFRPRKVPSVLLEKACSSSVAQERSPAHHRARTSQMLMSAAVGQNDHVRTMYAKFSC
jgi:hypothetical protein